MDFIFLWDYWFLALFMNTFLLQETHHPLILTRRAEELRRRTGNWGFMLHMKN